MRLIKFVDDGDTPKASGSPVSTVIRSSSPPPDADDLPAWLNQRLVLALDDDLAYIRRVRCYLALKMIEKYQAHHLLDTQKFNEASKEISSVLESIRQDDTCLRFHLVNKSESIKSLATADAEAVYSTADKDLQAKATEFARAIMEPRYLAWNPVLAPPNIDPTDKDMLSLLCYRRAFAKAFSLQFKNRIHPVGSQSRSQVEMLTAL